jgi:hypothetical protein
MPPVRVGRHLELDGDYAYVAGHPPDHQEPDLPTSKWAWNPVTFPWGRLDDFVEPTTVEARSAAVDDRDHADEFKAASSSVSPPPLLSRHYKSSVTR